VFECGSGKQSEGLSQPGRARRVLVVEDNVTVAENTARLLSLDGFEVQVVTDGPSALAAVARCPPDVVLLDLGLPGMDGYEVAKRIREQQAEQRSLLIAVTGYADKTDRLRSYEVGIDLHLTKPVSIEELRHFLGKFQTVATRTPP
jgi:CheY-like chemotaxis protein